MNRLTQAVLLLLFGGAILRASLTDLYLRYVREGLRPFLIAAGVLLVATAVMTLRHATRPDPAGQQHQHHHEPQVGWLLLMPVLGLVLVAPPALGSYAAGQAGSVVAAPAGDSAYPPLPPGDPAPISLLDYASRSLFDGGRSIAGRDLRLTGFLTPAPDGRPLLARIVLSCCAADGRPIKVGLAGRAPTGLPADTWVEIVGRHSAQTVKDPVNGVDMAFLEVGSWREIPEPRNPYA